MRYLFSILFSVLVSISYAHELTPQEALSNALQRLGSGVSAAKGSSVQPSMTLSYTENGTKTPLFYVFNKTNGGFIIAGADSRSTGLLGYTDDGTFDSAKASPAFQSWLSNCTAALEWLSQQPEATTTSSQTTTLTTSVAPLLGNIKWNQDAPYNLQCPKRKSGDNEKTAYTGCVATATAQVMYYYKWPKTAEGSNTNTNGEETDPNYTVDFSKSTYDWDNMKDTYESDETGTSADAVAKLMSDLGCALNMYYTYDGGGSNEFYVLEALTSYFKYDKSAAVELRKYYTTSQWNTLLRGELDHARPIIFGASNSAGDGHTFVLDGYDTNGLYHINWGWGGSSNGYFDINYMYPSEQGAGGSTSQTGYIIDQDAVIGIQKDTEGTSTASPALKIVRQINYDSSKNTFSFVVANYGTADFTGKIGFALYDANNNYITSSQEDFSNNPLKFGYSITCSWTIPSTTTIGSYYTVIPYYMASGSTEASQIPSQPASYQYLVAYKSSPTAKTYSWGYPNSKLPQLRYSDIKVVRNYTGYKPKFSITITNNSETVAYEGPVYIDITQTTKGKTTKDESVTTGYCFGTTQLFLDPGKTATIELEACQDYNNIDSPSKSYKDMTDGTYEYQIYYEIGGRYPYFYDSTTESVTSIGEFTMSTPAASALTYSGFSIDKSSLAQGDLLTASFTAQNTGGFDQKDYIFYIFKDGANMSVAYIENSAADLFGGGTSNKVSMSKTITLDPGTYHGRFYIYSGSSATPISPSSTTYKFTVTGSTAIREVAADEEENAVIYDLSGRRIKDMKKGGIYIINGKKVIR